MKVFIVAAKENWITDQLFDEWIKNNQDLYTNNIQDATIIWILSNYLLDVLPQEIYKKKKVITTIHHIVPWKNNKEKLEHYKKLNEITDVFHSICDKTTISMKQIFTKKIITKPFWNNQNLYFKIDDKYNLRKKHNIPKNAFVIGSFQRDTEGNSIENKFYLPKLEKGPDIFLECVKIKKNLFSNIVVILTGRCRQFLFKEFQKLKIKYIYFEMVDTKILNELYNCLDLYIVSSRVEGGPRAINECALAKVPIISSDVGIAKKILSEKSIFDINNLKTLNNYHDDTVYAYNQAKKLNIPDYFTEFNTIFT